MLFRSLLDCLMRRPNLHGSRRAAPRPPTCLLALEPLEDRCTPSAVLSVGDVTTLEGNAGTHNAVVPVTLSEPHGNSVTVNYNTVDATAKAGSDYSAASGKLTFARNEISKSILVPVIGDRVPEADKTFSVQLSNAKGAKIAAGVGIVTIVDDEPRISIGDVSGPEGNSGTTPFNFTVSLTVAYDLPVTVNYATTDGSATAGSDYTAAAGTVTFAPGQTSGTITVAVNGDRLAKPDKAFYINLSSPNSYAAISKGVGVGTIIDDKPRIRIGDAYNYGATSFAFTVSLSTAYDQDVTVSFATADGTAIAGVDYVAALGPLTFAPGDTTQTITVQVLDPTSAPDKYFSIHLSGASTNALVVNEQAYGYWYYDSGYYDYGYSYYDYGYGYYY
jgi:hypothetical protein